MARMQKKNKQNRIEKDKNVKKKLFGKLKRFSNVVVEDH